jgi:2-phosphosulfolactate phosphatase
MPVIDHATLENCFTATGTVVVIDVWRAFTTTAFAFDAGVRDIVPVGSTEEALALRGQFPDALVVGRGELGGLPAEGFDLGNSPTVLVTRDLHGRRMIHCTPNGTRGIVRSAKAETLLASSFVCAGATVRYIQRQLPAQVTFVSTGQDGEDQACAEYMAALLRDERPDVATVLGRIRDGALQDFRSFVSRGIWTEDREDKLKADLDCCLSLDRFDFAMLVQRRNGLLIMEAVS